jgi:two-component system response regulator CpxR
MNQTILLVDGDKQLLATLSTLLEQENFVVHCAEDGLTGIKKALAQPFDAIILDIVLPKMNGFQVLKTIRLHHNTPTIILSTREDEVDCLVAFKFGADDFIRKPCNPHEVIARVHRLLKRADKHTINRPIIEYHTMRLDCAQRQATIAGQEFELTNTEFKILEILIKSQGQAFSKEELTEYVLGRKYTAYDRSIDVHISNLRNKLGERPDGSPWLMTIRGFGYMMP